MTQRYSTLRAKLEELESILNDALLKGPEAHSHDDIKQKLAFIRNLFSAEVAAASSSSSNPSRPHHLHHISQKLATLEKKFHACGDTYGGKFFNGEEPDKDSAYSDGEGEGEGEGVVDDDTDLIVFEGQEKLFPDFIAEEKAIVEFRGDEKTVGFDKLGSFVYEDAEDFFAGENKELVEFDGGLVRKTEKKLGKDGELERAEDRRAESGFGKTCCCALGGGIVIGMFLMGFIMVNLSGCFHNVEQASFLIPT